MPSTKELDATTSLLLGSDRTFDSLTSASDREKVIGLVLQARHVEALEIANYVAVYGDYPEGYDARFA